MPTHYEYAVMSLCAYATDDRVNKELERYGLKDWKNIPHQLLDSSEYYKTEHWGFFARAYKNDQSKEIVIAIRGTHRNINWVTNLLLAALGKVEPPTTQAEAHRFTETVKTYCEDLKPEILITKNTKPASYTISFTGHSLGAIIAEICAGRYQCKAVTFDSPGCKSLFERPEYAYLGYELARKNIVTYLSAPNTVNTLHPQVADQKFRLLIPHENNNWHKFVCISNSASRLVLYSSIFSYGYTKFKTQFTSSLPSPTEAYLVSTLAIVSIMQRIKENPHLAIAGSMSAMLLTTMTSIFLPNARMETKWLFSQHDMENILACFNKETGEAEINKVKKIIKWPTRIQHHFLSRVFEEAKELLPFRSNYSIFTLKNVNALMERKITAIPGYEVEDITENPDHKSTDNAAASDNNNNNTPEDNAPTLK